MLCEVCAPPPPHPPGEFVWWKELVISVERPADLYGYLKATGGRRQLEMSVCTC